MEKTGTVTALKRHLSREKGKPIPIVCVTSYEFEGVTFKKGDISYRQWGRPCPDNWKDATLEDLTNYIKP